MSPKTHTSHNAHEAARHNTHSTPLPLTQRPPPHTRDGPAMHAGGQTGTGRGAWQRRRTHAGCCPAREGRRWEAVSWANFTPNTTHPSFAVVESVVHDCSWNTHNTHHRPNAHTHTHTHNHTTTKRTPHLPALRDCPRAVPNTGDLLCHEAHHKHRPLVHHPCHHQLHRNSRGLAVHTSGRKVKFLTNRMQAPININKETLNKQQQCKASSTQPFRNREHHLLSPPTQHASHLHKSQVQHTTVQDEHLTSTCLRSSTRQSSVNPAAARCSRCELRTLKHASLHQSFSDALSPASQAWEVEVGAGVRPPGCDLVHVWRDMH